MSEPATAPLPAASAKEPGDLLSFLESLLRRRSASPDPVLAVGWPESSVADRLRRRLPELSWAAGIAGVEEDGALSEGGTLIAVVPNPASRGRRGGLPNRDEKDLASLVRRLSETGFAIRRERQVADEEGEIWTVLVARRDPFVIRSYSAGDEEAILRLFPACFHVERGIEHWRWKYVENPWGDPKISMAFSPGGEFASQYASYPVPFWEADEPGRASLALQMGDTMTNPTFRAAGTGRSGLLARTVRHFFSIHRDGTCDFFYGFNTGPIQRFCRWFIGGSDVTQVAYWRLALDPPPEWKPGRYRVERVEKTGPAWSRFFERVAPHYGFLVRRDERWLDWRYLRCPDADFVLLAARRWGRLVGWCVFRRRDDRLVWGDALFDPRHAAAAESILATAVREPDLAGASRLVAWFPPRPAWWHERLPGLGLAEEPEPDGLSMVALADGREDSIERLRRLYYTMGDGDLF